MTARSLQAERRHPPSKWQRYRKRQARGEVVLRIIADENSLAGALISAGWLTEQEALSRERIAEMTSAIVREWCSRWK